MKTSPAYFDTSVLAKTYVKEPGPAKARQLVRTRQVINLSAAVLQDAEKYVSDFDIRISG
jgi:hypothetical protein